jgi:hypothetical protein
MKNLKLKVLDDQGKLVRAYSFTYDETEGSIFELTVDKTTHDITAEGKILPTINKNFIPYD